MQMNNHNSVHITSRDRLMRAWQNSMELVRDYQFYADETANHPEITAVFREFAEDEAVHAARFRELLLKKDR